VGHLVQFPLASFKQDEVAWGERSLLLWTFLLHGVVLT